MFILADSSHGQAFKKTLSLPIFKESRQIDSIFDRLPSNIPKNSCFNLVTFESPGKYVFYIHQLKNNGATIYYPSDQPFEMRHNGCFIYKGHTILVQIIDSNPFLEKTNKSKPLKFIWYLPSVYTNANNLYWIEYSYGFKEKKFSVKFALLLDNIKMNDSSANMNH